MSKNNKHREHQQNQASSMEAAVAAGAAAAITDTSKVEGEKQLNTGGTNTPPWEESTNGGPQGSNEGSTETNGQLSASESGLINTPTVVLLGVDNQPAVVLVEGVETPIADVVNAAFEKSGATVEEWNNFDPTDRADRVAFLIDKPADEPVAEFTEKEILQGAAAADLSMAAAATAAAPAEQTAAARAAPVVQGSLVSEEVAALLAQATPAGRQLFDQILSYATNMAPRKPMDLATGNRNQIQLYRTITGIINRLEEDFVPVFTALLRFAEEQREGVFGEIYLFRFMQVLELPAGDRTAFLALLNMIKILGPVKGREIALTQIDFERTLKHGVTEIGRQRVLSYFGK